MKRRPDVADSDVGGTETMRFMMLTAVVGFAAAATLLFGGRAAQKERQNSAERYEQRSRLDQEEARRQKQVVEGGEN